MNSTINLSIRRHMVVGISYVALAFVAVLGIAACGDQPASPTSGTPAPTASLVRGQEIFAQYCTKCHPGGGRGEGPSLIGRNDSADRIKRTVRNGDGLMPPFPTSQISDPDLDQLVAYVQSLK